MYFLESKPTCVVDYDRCFNKPLNNLPSFTLAKINVCADRLLLKTRCLE